MVFVVADVLDRLGRGAEVPIKQLTESSIALTCTRRARRDSGWTHSTSTS
jgi:hypothetical protein